MERLQGPGRGLTMAERWEGLGRMLGESAWGGQVDQESGQAGEHGQGEDV